MQNWQKERNYRKNKNIDGTFTYVVTIDGVDIEVPEEVYRVYSQTDRRERYCAERDSGRLLSPERMEAEDVPIHTYRTSMANPRRPICFGMSLRKRRSKLLLR